MSVEQYFHYDIVMFQSITKKEYLVVGKYTKDLIKKEKSKFQNITYKDVLRKVGNKQQ